MTSCLREGAPVRLSDEFDQFLSIPEFLWKHVSAHLGPFADTTALKVRVFGDAFTFKAFGINRILISQNPCQFSLEDRAWIRMVGWFVICQHNKTAVSYC